MPKTIIYHSQFDYGVGVDSAMEQRRGEAVNRTEPSSVEDASGSVIIYSTSFVTTQREMEEKLGVSTALSLSFGLFGTTSARADLSSEHTLDEYALYLIVQCTVQNAVKQMHRVTLTDAAKSLYEQDPNQFKKPVRRHVC
jgi:hypothetical protein